MYRRGQFICQYLAFVRLKALGDTIGQLTEALDFLIIHEDNKMNV